MSENAITSLIARQDWLETVGDALQKGVASLYENAGDAGQAVKDALHGTWLGHPLHAAITDVPVGAWTAAVVMDAMDEISPNDGLKRGADTAVGIGLAGAAIAAMAGLTDWSDTDGKARKIGLMHGLMNVAATGLFVTSMVKRKSDDRATGRALAAIGFAVAFGSAYLGGTLSYGEQIGVDHTVGQQFPDDFEAVLNDDDLHEGAMRRVEWRGSRILLARRDGQVYAMAEVCSHLGGPLAEGEFNGAEVRCPWHGSCFSVKDGSVIHGPATHPQPCLEVRVRDGKIEVKSSDR